MRVLVTGATGLLGGYLVAELERRGDEIIARGGPSQGAAALDLTDAAATLALVSEVRPDVIIHPAAIAAIADCARDPETARRVNVGGTEHVARAAEATRARLVHVSTDLVFDGELAPYAEEDPTSPISVYGRSKRDSEGQALATPGAVVVRTSLLFGPTRTARRGFFDTQLAALRRGDSIVLFDDEWRTPLSLRAAAEALVEIARSDMTGIVHLGGPERLSRHEMGLRLARAASCSKELIVRSSRLSLPGEPRPRDVSLDSSRFRAMFPALARLSFEEECERMLSAAQALT